MSEIIEEIQSEDGLKNKVLRKSSAMVSRGIRMGCLNIKLTYIGSTV